MFLFPPHASALALAVVLRGEPAEERIEALVLDVESVSAAELEAALDLRLPDRPRMPAGDPKARKQYELYAYVQIRRLGAGWELAVVLADGRAYYRNLEGDEEQIPRMAASHVANLVAGIEADTLRPDEEDVPIPDVAEPPPVITPARPGTGARPPASAPRPELGLRIGGGVVLGVPPPSPAGLAAGGGEIGLEFRSPAGALAAIAVRGGARVESGFALARLRVAALGGYVFRRGDFELIAAGGITIEPFFVQHGGDRRVLSHASGADRTPLVLGGLARLAPGYRRAMSSRVAFRIAPVLEIGGSGVPSGDGGVPRIRIMDETGVRDLFRVGGLEVFAGLELGAWWTIGGGASKRG